jgi:hypothetical protein
MSTRRCTNGRWAVPLPVLSSGVRSEGPGMLEIEGGAKKDGERVVL